MTPAEREAIIDAFRAASDAAREFAAAFHKMERHIEKTLYTAEEQRNPASLPVPHPDDPV